MTDLARSLPEAVTLISGASEWNRLPYAALALLAVGLLVRLPRTLSIVGLPVRALAAAALAWCVIPAAYRAETWWFAPALAAVILGQWALLEPLAARSPGSVALCLALSAFVAAGVLIHAGSARLTDATVVLGSALGGIAVASAWRRADASGAVPGAAALLPGLLLMGQQETFSEVSWLAFALAAAAPLMLVFAWPLHLRTGDVSRRGEAPGEPNEAGQSSDAHPAPDVAGSRRWLLMLVHIALMLPPWLAALYLARQAGPLEFE